MKYPNPKLFNPTEEDFSEAAEKVAKNLSSNLVIKTPKGKIIKGKRNSN